jgi:uroporphyrinogen III methyltransferase/synthase
VRPGAEIVPVGKRCGGPSTSQDEITERIVAEARDGRRVVRLKGGDPSVFGRLDEETGALRNLEMTYRVLPGVGAASAAAAFAGQPLTVREIASEIIFSTGRLAGGGKNPFPLAGRAAPAIALYMSRKVLAERMADLVPAGYAPETPVVVVEKLGSPEARAVAGTIESIAKVADRENVGTPAVVLVGAQFHDPDHLPLAGVRVWLPAEEETAESHREHLEELGATVTLVPLIAPVALPVDEGKLFTRPFDWVLFTSKKSVDFLFAALSRWGFDSRWLPRVAAIGGPTIEKLRARGIEPDLIPPEPTRVALSTSLVSLGLSGMRVLIPASEVAPDHVREALEPHAAEVVRANLYTLRFPRVGSVPEADIVLFSSESTVRSARENGLVDPIRERGMVVGGIGPATCRAIEREGLVPSIVPDGTDPASLARATHRYFARIGLVGRGAEPR